MMMVTTQRSGRQPGQRFRGPVLPDGEVRDLYVVDGRITFEAQAGAETVAEGWIVPGLVDAHCHVGLDADGAVDEETQEKQALTDRDAGALMLRDCAHEVEPLELPAYVAQEAQRGDGWVKLVGDWIERDSGDLAPSFPADAFAEAIRVAHDHGAKVTAHCFGEAVLPGLIGAGIDCIEHGTGLSEDLIDEMVARGTALVPTAMQLNNFPEYASAAGEKFPTYAEHMHDLYGRRRDTIMAAYEAGVAIYAGTDAGGVLPHGMISSEVRELADYGFSAEAALGAASWRAREWLGLDGRLSEGTTADFVVFDRDPLQDLSVLAEPSCIVLRGRVVA